MAREVTLRITASSDDESPVVPMMLDQAPACAAMATLAMVRPPATVKSRIAVGIGRQCPQIRGQQNPVGGQACQYASHPCPKVSDPRRLQARR